ncbi:hypothetical protein NDU88_001014, partial [Pleurodeles waltl]
ECWKSRQCSGSLGKSARTRVESWSVVAVLVAERRRLEDALAAKRGRPEAVVSRAGA